MRPGLRSRILPGRRGAAEEKTLPPGYEEIEHQEFSTLFGRIVVARLGLIPLILGAVGWIAMVDVTPWRRATLLLVGLAAPLFFLVEWFRFRRKGVTPLALPLNLCFAALVISTLSFATGGLASPFLVVLVPFAMLSGLFSPGRKFALVTGVELVAVWALWGFARHGPPEGFYPEVFGNRTLAPHLLTVALVYSFVLLMVTAVTRFTRAALQRTIGRTLLAQQESLRAHAERAEELTAMSAEIAHELRNPLASVKGLAGLLAQGAAEPKAKERLAVLRREVDRMQAILDGFLNFSRPLVPLALGDTDVGALCREVAALHEGLARDRGAALEVRADAVLARCDPRKVKQIVINLVRNALEAAPAGARAEVEVVAEPLPGGGARVQVRDRGRGLDPALGASLFSPGATTKPHGSGLGLPISRALARQHGGEVTVSPREGGGVVAELTLPAAPAAGGAPGRDGGRAA